MSHLLVYTAAAVGVLASGGLAFRPQQSRSDEWGWHDAGRPDDDDDDDDVDYEQYARQPPSAELLGDGHLSAEQRSIRYHVLMLRTKTLQMEHFGRPDERHDVWDLLGLPALADRIKSAGRGQGRGRGDRWGHPGPPPGPGPALLPLDTPPPVVCDLDNCQKWVVITVISLTSPSNKNLAFLADFISWVDDSCVDYVDDQAPLYYYAVDELYNASAKELIQNKTPLLLKLTFPSCIPKVPEDEQGRHHIVDSCSTQTESEVLLSPLANVTGPLSRIVVNKNSVCNLHEFVARHYMPSKEQGVLIRIFTDAIQDVELSALHYLIEVKLKAKVQLYVVAFDDDDAPVRSLHPHGVKPHHHYPNATELADAMRRDQVHRFDHLTPYCGRRAAMGRRRAHDGGGDVSLVKKVALAAAGGVVLILFVAALVLYCKARRQKRWWKMWKKHSGEAQQRAPDTQTNSVKMRYIDVPNQNHPASHTIEHDKWEVSRAYVKVDYSNKLGSGAFSTVYKGRLITAGLKQISATNERSILGPDNLLGIPVAVKMLPLYADFHSKMDFVQEITFMKDLGNHAHLVNLVACITLEDPISLISEYCEHGDLLNLVRSRKEQIAKGTDPLIKPKTLLTFAWQISDGLAYLAAKGCIHRDVAARNVLVAENLVAKLGDFGLCRLAERNLYTTRGGRLPMKWMAPESLSYCEYTHKSDVWSLGVLYWEAYSLGEVPFAWVQPADIADHLAFGHRLEQPQFCPDDVYAIMKDCWLEAAERRPDVTEVRRRLADLLAGLNGSNYNYVETIVAGSNRSSGTPPVDDRCVNN